MSLIQPPLSVRKRIPGAGRALGVFAVAWLSLALQPCAMAAGEHVGCPGCPPGTEHSGMSGMSHHATPEAPDDSGVPCAVEAFDCLDGEAYSHDVRGVKLSLHGAQGDVPGDGPDGGAGYAAFAVLDTSHAHPGMFRDPMPDAARRESVPRAAPSRNVLFCVYLK